MKDIIQKYYGVQSVERINNRLLEKYGIDIDTAIKHEDTKELEAVLREEFTYGPNRIMLEYVNSLNLNLKNHETIKLNNMHSVTDKIIQILGDFQSLNILNVTNSPKTVYSIANETNITQSTIYRKSKFLASVGLLTKTILALDGDAKIKTKYEKTYEKIVIIHTEIMRKVTVTPKYKYYKKWQFIELHTKS